MSKASDDIQFLAKRASRANGVSFTDDGRDTGVSSNSIVSRAYGLKVKQEMPYDQSDLDACERMFAKLPAAQENACGGTRYGTGAQSC